MPEPLINGILDRVLSDLAGINGTGGYWFDLSGTGAVVEGEPPPARPRGPVVYLTDARIAPSEYATLGETRYSLEIPLLVVGVASTGDEEATPTIRRKNLYRLCSDVARALVSDPTLNGQTWPLRVEFETIQASAIGWQGAPVAMATVRLDYTRRIGNPASAGEGL